MGKGLELNTSNSKHKLSIIIYNLILIIIIHKLATNSKAQEKIGEAILSSMQKV